jgi:hypothetical protein
MDAVAGTVCDYGSVSRELPEHGNLAEAINVVEAGQGKRGVDMRTGQGSLRWLVEKWMSPSCATALRISRCGHTDRNGRRYVRVHAERSTGPLEVAFFRHDDGCWHVFPQAPTMHANWPEFLNQARRKSVDMDNVLLNQC